MSTISYTLNMPKVARLDAAPFGFIMGVANLTSFSVAADTALLGYFKPGSGLMAAVAGVSSNGYALTWSSTSQCWVAYETGAALNGPLEQVPAATNVGTFSFIAMGQMG